MRAEDYGHGRKPNLTGDYYDGAGDYIEMSVENQGELASKSSRERRPRTHNEEYIRMY